MEKILQGIEGVTVYIDDILVTGRTEEQHLHTLEIVLERLHQYGLRLKRGKCSFMQPSVQYLGYVIDKEGLHTTPEKVQAILNSPIPKDVYMYSSYVRSSDSVTTIYGKFIPNLSTIAQPLNQLLCKNVPWKWTGKYQTTFETLKEKLASSEVLVHYDPDLALKLDCDASAYRIGAILSHTFPNGEEKPIAYASWTLSKAEKGYSQLEKEALSLIYGVKKYHQYLYGRRFLLVTDHNPLLTILGPKKQLPTLAAARLQRWALTLSAYRQFRPTGEHCNADGFSRLPVVVPEPFQDVAPSSVFNLMQIAHLPVGAVTLQKATRTDPLISHVVKYTLTGWPSTVEPELKPYWTKRMELSVEAGCLLWGIRIVVPQTCQRRVLEELHVSHPGIVKMKSLARIHVWWPEIDVDIKKLVRECNACRSVRNAPSKAFLQPWAWPEGPWKRIHIDFAGPFQNSMFLVIVDAYSKWLEVVPMNSTTTEKTLDVLRSMFARYGLPERVVSDNGPQFTATELEEFMRKNGVKHIRDRSLSSLIKRRSREVRTDLQTLLESQ